MYSQGHIGEIPPPQTLLILLFWYVCRLSVCCFCCKQSSTQSSPPNVPGGGVPGQDSYQFGAGGYGVVGGAPSSASFGQPPPGQQGSLQFRIDLGIAPLSSNICFDPFFKIWIMVVVFTLKANFLLFEKNNFLLCTPLLSFFLSFFFLCMYGPNGGFILLIKKRRELTSI